MFASFLRTFWKSTLNSKLKQKNQFETINITMLIGIKIMTIEIDYSNGSNLFQGCLLYTSDAADDQSRV